MAFPDLTINEQYDLKAKYNEVTLAMEAATLTLNPQTMARVAAALAAIPLPANSALVDEFSQYDLLANMPPQSSLGVKVGLVLNSPPGSAPVKGFALSGTGAYVQKGAQVALQNSAGAAIAGGAATIGVTNSVAQYARLPSNVAGVISGSTAILRNFGGGNIGTVTATVSSGVQVLALASHQALVTDGTAITVPVTGTYVSKITPTIVSGAITGFVLS